ncbi:hypothetical protein BLA24064_01399 [Burkholderia latens]|uniref:Uncharacterized protein n=1 Tax=Burkholderia latens TaxID=488446 RepID=A0A6P2IVD5_9BURK|nr:hypothetical protein BLA24064_01399 [Burkholderia latens]
MIASDRPPPINAAAASVTEPISGHVDNANSVTSPAPCVTPSTSGPASGLRTTLCIATPLTASSAPASSAHSSRGMRRSISIRASASWPDSAADQRAGDSHSGPADTPTNTASTPAATNSAVRSGQPSRSSQPTIRVEPLPAARSACACSTPDHAAPRRIIASISGVPTSAIATPVDSVASRPDASTALSVTSTSAPPVSADSGTSTPSRAARAPRTWRSRFGATRPTYDSGPAMLTATLVNATATIVAASRVASTRTPAAAAASSPSASGFSGRITNGNATSGTTSQRAASASPVAPG